MQPFSITCETCQARLKVRNESAIGQILSCPQCQSMVQIVAPEGWSCEPQEAISEATNSTAPRLAKTEAPPITVPQEATPSASVDSIPTPNAAVPLPLPAEPLTGLDPLDPGWTSPAEQAWRKVILWSVSGGLGLLMIGALVGTILTLRSDELPVVPQPVAEVPDSVLNEEPEEESVEERTPVPSDEASQEKLPSASSVGPPAVEIDSAPEDKPAEEDTAKPRDDPEKKSNPENQPPEVSEDELKLAVESEEKDPVAPESWVARRVPPSDEPTHTHDVASQLSEKIIRINFRDVPLAHLMQFLSDMTALPITLDLPGLASTDVTPLTRVSIRKEDTTVVEVLTAVLSEQGLTYLTQGDQLLVTSPSASSSKLRTLRYPIDDLVNSAEDDTKALSALLQVMVAPGSWQTAGGSGTIQIDEEKLAIKQTMPVHQQLVTFCERLHVARGLPTRSRYSTDRFRLATRHSRAGAVLGKQVSFTFHEPTRLTDVVRHLEANTGATVVVNWRSLAREKFTFASRIECSIKEQTLDSALTAMLTPLGLAWQPVDAQTVEILGRSDVEKKPIREFYPLKTLLAAGVHDEEILDHIRQGTAAELWDNQKGPGTLYFDQPSKHLVVRHTYPVQVQVQRLLAQLTDQLGDGSN